MKITASTLYEAVEPHAMWKELLNTVLSDILSQKPTQQVRTTEPFVQDAC